MAKYSYQQLQDLWKSVGGSAVSAPFAAAIALAESGGDSGASHGNSNGTTDRGLWQINSIHGGLSTMDPKANARAAVQISHNGTNWRPWCTAWSNGKCGGTFMGDTAPVFKYFKGDAGSVGMSTPAVSAGNAVSATPVFGNPFSPQTWAQAFLRPVFVSTFYGALGFVGAAMMVVGFIILVAESKTAGVVRKMGGKALKTAPQTRAVGSAVEAKEEAKEEAETASETATEYDSDADSRGRHTQGGGRHRGES